MLNTRPVNTPILGSLLAVLLSMMLSACASLPAELSSENPDVVTSYTVWTGQPEQSVEVRLGGVIDRLENLQDKTRIEIVSLPIDSAGRPDIDVEPQGRFIAYVDGYLEPVTYARGRLITVLGQSTGERETVKVGESEHQLPVMQATGSHVWRIEQRMIINDYGAPFQCWDEFCDWGYDFGPRQREGRIIQQVK
ncbi:Slp family lipoprotein [Vibrio sp.]|uniref:Slp family lipoprotein n=1 Tax=Vibrio sp. TaxID=678 RepID=UPI003D13F5B4